MNPKKPRDIFKNNVQTDVNKLEKAKKERFRVLAQTIYLGTLGLVFILPVIVCGYIGIWLDNKLKGYSFSWTISLLFLGILVGAINVYLLMKE